MRADPFARLPGPALAAVKWFSIAMAMVAVVPVLLLSTRRAPAPATPTKVEPIWSLPLTLTGEDGRLSLGWDREAPAIQAGQCGILWITDGGIHRRVILDASQLRAGKLFYWPVNRDVSFEIKISEANNTNDETACGNDATALPQPAERPARRERRAEKTASRSKVITVPMAQRQYIQLRQPEAVSGSINARIEPRNSPAFSIEGESQLVAPLQIHAVQLQAVSEQILRTARMPALLVAPEPYSTVTVEPVAESRLSPMVSKIPLLRRLRRPPGFLPPRPVRESAPTVPPELGRTLNGEVPLDVRAYINESGKVTYAEMLSNVTEANLGLASLAVFDARHWEFMPARLGAELVPGQVVLHYRFANPMLAIAHDPR